MDEINKIMNEEQNIMQDVAILVKSCKKCNTVKPLEDFNKQTKMKGGFASICKVCKSILNKERYNNPEFDRVGYIEKQKGWNKENPKKLYTYIKRSRKKNKQLLKKEILKELEETSPDLLKEIVS
jgi:hypothetical protein